MWLAWLVFGCIESGVSATEGDKAEGRPPYDATTHDADHDGFVDAEDCKPDDVNVHPDGVERCNGQDDDCDGKVDEGDYDADDDGYDDQVACYGLPGEMDCRDDDASVHPGAAETCDYVDEDCNGTIDDGDLDGDGALTCDDCDDLDAFILPGAAEACDGLDNDCDDLVDDGWDFDGDGYSECQGDCEPEDGDFGPDADEACDGVDNDCDGRVDEDDDLDADGVPTCEGDCDDTDASAFPGAEEVCDGVDNDCDASSDEAVDADGDGYSLCLGDCDEASSAAIPGGVETCDGVDNDCNGYTDESYACYGCTTSGSYVLCSSSTTWALAENACEGFGGALVRLSSASENDDVASLTARPTWIGANDIGTEGVWVWPDGSTLGFDSWASGYPTSSDAADCAITNDGGRRGDWIDVDCTGSYPFACEL